MGYRAVCFDFDYTLADATDSIVAGFQHALPSMGYPKPEREPIRHTIGYMLEDGYTLLTGDNTPEGRARFRELYLEVALPIQLKGIPLFPGAHELLRGLKEKGVKAGIVSSRRLPAIQSTMEQEGLMDCLEFIIGGEHVHKPKPDPQGLLEAMARLNVRPEEFLYCGDTVLDAGAARNAGCPFCAVLNGTTAAAEFAPYPAVHTAPDLFELARWLEA